jgi:peptide deformylase
VTLPAVGDESGLFPILKYGSGILRRKAEPAEPGNASTRALLEGLWATLADDGGVGLAAPQVGHAQRVVVIRDRDRPPGKQRLDLVNPRITEAFGPLVPFEEGCLSFPGLYTTVERPRGVTIEYHDADGNLRIMRDERLVARIVQHEIDHLDGVLFIDHLAWYRKLTVLPRLAFILLGKLWEK